ncbi:MAG: ATPase, partial [Bacteroidetes bacterium QS_4_64_154]
EEVVFRGIFIDITERKRREQDLKESRRKLRKEKRRVQSITENVSDGIYRSTAEEGIVYANQAFVEMFGYRDLGELRAAGSEALYVNPGRREELIEKENREGRLHQEEVRYRRKDETTFIGLLNTQRVEGEYQEKTYFDGAVTDITERKRHEQKLRRRREDIEALYDATRSLLRAGGRGEVHDRIHTVLRRVFDYDLINKYLDRETIRAVQTDHSGDAELPPLTAGSASGDSIVAQVLRDGETVVAEDLGGLESDIDYGALRSAAGVPVGERGVIIVGQAEETSFDCFNLRLIEVLADYAALVLGRLGREEGLIEAKTEAEEANQMKSAFLANMSHEIRTPLTNILGFAEAIEEETEGLEPPVEAGDLRPLGTFAGLIQRGGRRLMETLTSILTLSELEAGEMELEAEPVDLGAQACRVAEEL